MAQKNRCFLCAGTCESVGVLFFFFYPEWVQTPTHRGLGRCKAWFNKAKKHVLRNKATLPWILFNLCQYYYITVYQWEVRVQGVGYFQITCKKNPKTEQVHFHWNYQRKERLFPIYVLAAELHPFINYAFDVTCVDLAKLGIPQCIPPWQTKAAAMLKSLNIKVQKSKEPLQKFHTEDWSDYKDWKFLNKRVPAPGQN